MKQNIKNLIRRLLFESFGRLYTKIGNEKDLVILSSSRSGSTWLVETLTQSNKFMIYNQPFDRLLNNNVYSNRLPEGNPYFVNISNKEKLKVEKFLDDILDDRIFPNVQWRIWKNNSIFYKRKLLKVFFAKDLLSDIFLDKNFDLIYLLRHPISRALSNINYNYPNGCEYLIYNNKISDTIGRNNMKYLKKNYKHYSKLSKHILGWFLENYLLLISKGKLENNILYIHYEDMIHNPEIISEELHKHFGLQKLVFLDKPSSTTKKDELETLSLRRRAASYNYNLSQLDISDDEINQIIEIFDIFSNKIYTIST